MSPSAFITPWADIEAFEPDLGLDFEHYTAINDELMRGLYEQKEGVLYELYRLEADEMWSFMGN